MFHLQARRYLAAYADDELDSALRKKIEKHINHCTLCQADLDAFQQAKTALMSLTPSAHCPDRVWLRVSERVHASETKERHEPSDPFTHRIFPSYRLAFPLGFAVIVLSVLAIMLFTRNHVEEPMRQTQTAFMAGFDYHLFLDELMKSGSTPTFNSMYASERITGEKANTAAGFITVVKPQLQKFHLQEISLLTNTCCHALQLTYVSDKGKVFVFQQPEDHPLRFDHKEAHEMQVDGFKCLLMQQGTYRSALLKTEKGAFVVVGDVDSTTMKDFLRSLASNTF